MSSILVYSEREALALELLTGARDIASARGASLAVALLGDGATERADACFQHGAEKAYVAADSALDDAQTDVTAEALAQIARQADADLVLVGSTRRGRVLAPRLAQKLEAGCVTDAGSLTVDDGRLVTTRLALGGNTLKEEAITSPHGVIAVSPGVFEASPGGTGPGSVEEVSPDLPLRSRARTVERQAKERGAVNIEEAERLVCIGRGVGSKDDLPVIEALAAALGGEVAGTRPLSYEYEWLPEDSMIGISGKTVRPQLYVAIGLSGQIQHTVSIRDSRVIVAINKDKSAPIFEMADYGIVGDLYEVVPLLTEALGRGD
jgi:electron transfer flavoprotein alpha subunit